MQQRIVEGAFVLEGFEGDVPVVHENAALRLVDGLVAEIAPTADLARRFPGLPRLGGPKAAVIPGLVNAHHHVGATPLQLGSPDHPLELWFASRLALRDVDPRLDTLFSAFEMIASGVTTVQHLHSRAAGGIEGLWRAARGVLGAYGEIGMRVSYSMALRDQNRLVYEDDAAFTARLPAELRPAMRDYFAQFLVPFDEQLAFHDALRAEIGEARTVRIQLAPSNLHWLSDGALERLAAHAERTRAALHAHIVETPYQRAYAKKRTGGTALAHLHRHGLVSERLTVGHGVWLSAEDVELIAETGACVCHNCSSNLRLKSGIAPVNRLLARGIPVALGIDEAGINDDRDMLQEMRLALRLHRPSGIDAPAPDPAQVLRMATEHGARTTPYGASIGALRPGCEADLAVLDWDTVTAPWQSPDIPPVDVLVQRAKAGAVTDVVVAGEVVYRDRRFTRVDREAVMSEIAAWFARPPSAAEEARRALAAAVFPYVKAFYDGYLEDPLPPDPRA